MREVVFVVSFMLLAIGTASGHKLLSGSAYGLPLNAAPLKHATNIASIISIPFFIFGFFAFSWWLPIASLILFMTAGAAIGYVLLRSGVAPLGSLAASVFGIVGAGVTLAL
jgi:hypothetical protein